MAAADLVRTFLDPIDPRTPREIGRDIEDEIAFHLDQLERELVETGTPPEQARDAALLRFGDPQRIRRACERIAMENQLMLQKINLVLMVVVVIAVAAVSVQMFTTQRYNTLALQAITADLAEMKAGAEARESGVVYVDGAVKSPGVYDLPARDEMTLSRLLTAAGGVQTQGARISVFRRATGTDTQVAVADFDPWSPSSPADDVVLASNDLVVVRSLSRPLSRSRRIPEPSARLTPGLWRQVGTGDAFLQLLDAQDVNNFAGRPSGVLEIPAAGMSLRLTFGNVSGKNLNITAIPMVNGGIGHREGRWVLEDDVLSINLGDIMPLGQELLLLERADASDASG